MTKRVPMSPAHRDAVDELLSATFNSIVSIEERMTDSVYTKDLTLTELHAICAVGLHDETPMSVIASRLNVTTATVSGTINRLVRKGFVERTRSDRDRRVVLVRLTKNGRGAMRVHDLFHRKMVENVLEGMTSAEEDVFLQAMERLKRYFEQERLYQADDNPRRGRGLHSAAVTEAAEPAGAEPEAEAASAEGVAAGAGAVAAAASAEGAEPAGAEPAKSTVASTRTVAPEFVGVAETPEDKTA